MDAIREQRAMEAARANELHASHDAMSVVGEQDGKVLVLCSCSVLLAVDVPTDQPVKPARRSAAREEGGE